MKAVRQSPGETGGLRSGWSSTEDTPFNCWLLWEPGIGQAPACGLPSVIDRALTLSEHVCVLSCLVRGDDADPPLNGCKLFAVRESVV